MAGGRAAPWRNIGLAAAMHIRKMTCSLQCLHQPGVAAKSRPSSPACSNSLRCAPRVGNPKRAGLLECGCTIRPPRLCSGASVAGGESMCHVADEVRGGEKKRARARLARNARNAVGSALTAPPIDYEGKRCGPAARFPFGGRPLNKK